MWNRDILKLLMYARGPTMRDNENIPSKMHLQKEMLLLLKETVFPKVDGYKFVPHYYGPFPRELDSDLIDLVVSGKVVDTDGYVLIPEGFRGVYTLWNSLDQSHKIALWRVKKM